MTCQASYILIRERSHRANPPDSRFDALVAGKPATKPTVAEDVCLPGVPGAKITINIIETASRNGHFRVTFGLPPPYLGLPTTPTAHHGDSGAHKLQVNRNVGNTSETNNP